MSRKRQLSSQSTLANNIKRLMQESRTYNTQEKLAEGSGVHQTTISRILKEVHPTSIDHIEAIAGLFGLKAWHLLVTNLDPQNPPEQLSEAELGIIKQIRANQG